MYKIIVNTLFVIVLGLLSIFGLGALYDRPRNKEPTIGKQYIIQKGYNVDSLIRVDTLYLDTFQKPSSYG